MIEWLMIFVGGLLGSSHCIGMCGGFAISLGAARPGLAANLCRQSVYSLGRVFTYTVGGAVAGYGGLRLTLLLLHSGVNVQSVLSMAAGILLIVEGLMAAGVIGRFHRSAVPGSCLGPTFFAGLLNAPGMRNVFLAGLVNGLLPCGLVYAYLALATSSGNMLSGAVTMVLFGLGTVPMMVLLGCGGSVLGLVARRKLLRVAAWCVVLTGVISIVRGLGFLHLPGLFQESGCPMCH